MDPRKKLIMMWEILVCLAYLLCYFIDPFVFAYGLTPLMVYPITVNFSRFLTYMITLDILINPFIAKRKVERFGET